MCGLFGYISADPHLKVNQRGQWLTQMIYLSSLRGVDGTGVAFLSSKEEVPRLVKSVLPGHVFIETPEYQSNLGSLGKYECVIGHTRKSTIGERTYKNAHPFWEEPILLAHNGTLKNYHELEGNFGLTDSQRMTITLAKNQPDYVKVIAGLEGAYAITWYDFNTHKLYATRNDERSLYFIKMKDSLYWASEMWMLRGVLERVGLCEDKTAGFYPAKNNVFSWNINGKNLLEKSVSFIPKPLPIVKPEKLNNEWIESRWLRNARSNFSALVNKPKVQDHSALIKKAEQKIVIPKEINDVVPKIDDFIIYEVNGFLINKGGKSGHLMGTYIHDQIEFEVNDYNLTKKLWDTSKQYSFWKAKISFIKANSEGITLNVTNSIPVNNKELPPLYKGPDGKLVSLNIMMWHIQDGCSKCFQPINIEDLDNITWDKNENPICTNCSRKNRQICTYVV